jgi:hypothetical protein
MGQGQKDQNIESGTVSAPYLGVELALVVLLVVLVMSTLIFPVTGLNRGEEKIVPGMTGGDGMIEMTAATIEIETDLTTMITVAMGEREVEAEVLSGIGNGTESVSGILLVGNVTYIVDKSFIWLHQLFTFIIYHIAAM